MDRILNLLSFIWAFVGFVACDYQCVCNHHTQRGIFDSPSTGSPPLAFLYQDECKALAWIPNLDKKWQAIQFYHLIGYIETDSDVDITLCQGQIPDEDKASTQVPPPTIQSTSRASITHYPPTTPKSTSSMPMIQSTTSPRHETASVSETFAVPSRPLPSTVLSIPTISSTLHTTAKTTTHDHADLCPRNIKIGASYNRFLLAQYDHSCFEFCNAPISWAYAESLCRARGGHLVTIDNVMENNYLHQFMVNHFGHTEFWIGLNDRADEGQFKWTSGAEVTYKHWSYNRLGPHNSQEDCAVILSNGRWDDRNCGSDSIFTAFVHTRYPYICEYDIDVGYALIG